MGGEGHAIDVMAQYRSCIAVNSTVQVGSVFVWWRDPPGKRVTPTPAPPAAHYNSRGYRYHA